MDETEEEDARAFGLHNSNTQVIRLARGRKRQRIAVTFLHEILHAFGYLYGPEVKDGMVKEEEQVGACGFGLTAFIRDNPEAWAWFVDLAVREPAAPYERSAKSTA
ncbi:MAG: hypothetical protein ABIF19_17090 [Planctomycetota bacterium]